MSRANSLLVRLAVHTGVSAVRRQPAPPAGASSPRTRRPSPSRRRAAGGRPALLALLSAAFCWAAQPALQAQGTGILTTLFAFGDSASDGSNPNAALVLGKNGDLYGTTASGGSGAIDGSDGGGTVFQITNGSQLATLYTFGENSDQDGSSPEGALVQGRDGNFYGTTLLGGVNGDGTVFEVGAGGGLTTLYSFTNGSDGSGPEAALVQGTNGNFYGTTTGGGVNGHGTVFEIGAGGGLTTLYSFSGSDGGSPQAALVLGDDGNLYGTTFDGGASDFGTLFRVSASGTLTTLYSFSGNDGARPNEMVQGSDGNLYGTTSAGGANDDGTVFRLTLDGVLTTLYSFGDGDDGNSPNGALVQDDDGDFYGTTYYGGPDNAGTVFRINADGVLTTLYRFTGGNDGAQPSSLVLGSDGNFYGTTSGGAAMNDGTVFQVAAVGAAFFDGEVPLGDGVYYLAFPNGNVFGYYEFLSEPNYIYHFDLGFEYVFDAKDGEAGVYFYDFASSDYFYTSPVFPFPYLYDFGLNAFLYYYPDTTNPGHYTSNPRYFYNFNTAQIITK